MKKLLPQNQSKQSIFVITFLSIMDHRYDELNDLNKAGYVQTKERKPDQVGQQDAVEVGERCEKYQRERQRKDET